MIEVLTSLLVIITAIYAYLTFRILHSNRESVAAMRAQIDAALRPYVHFDLVLQGPLVEATVRNAGVTAALNAKITTNPPLLGTIRNETRPSRLTATSLALLAPGRELREFIGRIDHVRSLTDTLSFTATVEYRDMAGHTYRDDFSIDLAGLFEMPYIDRPHVGKELKNIGETLKEIQRSIKKTGDGSTAHAGEAD